MKNTLLYAFLLAVAGHSFRVSALDCTSLFFEETSGVLNWLGNVTIVSPVATTSWTIVQTFDQQFTGVGVWDAWVQYNGAEKWARLTDRENGQLAVGQELKYRFRINYGTEVPKPKLVSLVFQDLELCK